MPILTKLTSLLSIISIPLFSISQITIGRIDSVKDVNGVICAYIGEIKGNKPNGRGLLIYPEGKNALRLTGFFVNGLAKGKGLILFNDAFNCGSFLNGKLEGKIAFRSGSTFGVEMLIGGLANGITTAVTDNDMMLFFRKKADIEQGSKLYVDANGHTMYHKYMLNGKQSGAQIQYEVKYSNLFEGYWKDDKWIKQPITFKSLLKDKNYKGFSNDKAVGMGIFNKDNVMSDTAFLMGADGNERYFGKFAGGEFVSGVQSYNGTRFIGNMKDGKAQGECFFFKAGNSFLRGNYFDNILNDSSCVFLNLENRTTYIGGAVNGAFEGKGISSTNDNILFIGTFKNNRLDGKCTKVYPSGYSITGTWIKDTISSAEYASDSKGSKITLYPASYEEGITLLARHFENVKIFSTQDSSAKKYNLTVLPNVLAKVAYKSLFRLKDSEYDEIISILTSNYQSLLDKTFNYQDEYFISTLKSGADSVTAMKYYKDLCGQLKQLQLTLAQGAKPVMLKEKKLSYESGIAFTIFEFPEEAKLENNVTVQATVLNGSGQPGDYSVVLLLRTGDVQFFK